MSGRRLESRAQNRTVFVSKVHVERMLSKFTLESRSSLLQSRFVKRTGHGRFNVRKVIRPRQPFGLWGTGMATKRYFWDEPVKA